jgi:hypothetical protein
MIFELFFSCEIWRNNKKMRFLVGENGIFQQSYHDAF